MNCGVVMAFSSTRWCRSQARKIRWYISCDRLAALARIDVLHLEVHRQRLLGLQPEVDDPDLAFRPGPGRLLQALVDQRAGRIGVVDAKNRTLVGLADQVEQIACGPARLAFRGQQGEVMTLGPAVGLQRLEKALLLHEQDLVARPVGPPVALDLQRAERDTPPVMRMVERAARVAVGQGSSPCSTSRSVMIA